MQAVEVDAQRHQHAQANLGDLRWSEVSCHLSVAAVRRREGEATLLSTGSHGSWVGFRHPEIRCIELCSWLLGVEF